MASRFEGKKDLIFLIFDSSFFKLLRSAGYVETKPMNADCWVEKLDDTTHSKKTQSEYSRSSTLELIDEGNDNDATQRATSSKN